LVPFTHTLQLLSRHNHASTLITLPVFAPERYGKSWADYT